MQAFYRKWGWFFPLHTLFHHWIETCWHCFRAWSVRVCLEWRQWRSFDLKMLNRQLVRYWVVWEWVEWWLYRWLVCIISWWSMPLAPILIFIINPIWVNNLAPQQNQFFLGMFLANHFFGLKDILIISFLFFRKIGDLCTLYDLL